jgi:hypothetical protein
MKKPGFLALALCAVVAAIVTGAFVVYGRHIQHGAPATAIEFLVDLFFLPGLFLSAVFMLSMPATLVLMHGGAFLELFVLFWIIVLVVKRLRRRDA